MNYEFLNKVNNKTNLLGLTNELKSLYLAKLNSVTQKSVIYVTSSNQDLMSIYDSLQNYSYNSLLFPADDYIVESSLAVSPEYKNNRLNTLNELLKDSNKILVTNLNGLIKILPAKDNHKQNIINLEVNKDYNHKQIADKLFESGYTSENLVNKTGEVAVRGFVIDVFAINYDNPIRIEFWGDTVTSIRFFDVDTQLTVNNVDSVDIYSNSEKYTNSNNSILDYFNDYILVFDNYKTIENNYVKLLEQINEYIKVNELENNDNHIINFNDIKKDNVIYFSDFDEYDEFDNYNVFSNKIDNYSQNIDSVFDEILKKTSNYIVVVCLDDQSKAKRIINHFNNENIIMTTESNLIKEKVNIIIKKINEGYIIDNYYVVSENELFNRKREVKSSKSNLRIGKKVLDISKLELGDYVVHYVHGIGVYAGLTTITKNGLKKDYIQINYKGNDKLYIPVEKIDLISKYSSSQETKPKISKLGSADWEKAKKRANDKAKDIAQELLKLYAKREMSVGYAFSKDGVDQIEFEKEFPFEETEDQLKVTEEIKKDMERPIPMDRLVCGDVGFGKTEVAFRAIFKAVMDNKQAIILCPTTLLSRQHYLNAIERFKSFPIRVELLNRFVNASKQKKIINDIKDGKVDIVIGTHRLLSGDILYRDLGILVVDEEQRFGVKHKEKIKEMKANIDVLTLSATPIPRTIQMSLSGIKGLSLIETPPTNRYPIQTYVLEYNEQIIRDSIMKELSRNGQVFILNNKIEQMETYVNLINRLVPTAKVVFAHGQMNKNTLENVMMKFTNRDYDVLISTTIIETGIDIPSANTLIIFDADYFGLSQLYQIRGRVGRSNKSAYCYLMYNKNKILNTNAIKRLKAIKEFTELGSGFAIAMRDLSIRGAGDILGSEQAGFVDTVGIELFMKMLNKQIAILKGDYVDDEINEEQPIVDVQTNINKNYVGSDDLIIELHKKINTIDSYETLLEIKNEIEDRFGRVDDNLLIYMHQEWFEKYASKLNVKNINQNKYQIEINLNKEQTSQINGETLFIELSKYNKYIRFDMNYKRLTIIINLLNLDKHFIYYSLEVLKAIEKSLV